VLGREDGKRVSTIRDVAHSAGVSAATVSRVLNGYPHVSPTVVHRVQAAVAALGYRPNGVARSLRQKSTRVWGLIIADIQNPFFTAIVRGVEDVAYESGSSLLLCNSDENLEKEQLYLDIMLGERVAGVLIAPASQRESDFSMLLQHNIPVVAIDRTCDRTPVDTVLVDNRTAARDATTHLLEAGSRRVACIVGSPLISTSAERLAGYSDALNAAGISYDERLVRYADSQTAGGYAAMHELLAHAEAPDAVFVGNNLMTIGALEAIRANGLSIPADIAIVGFDDMVWASVAAPSLTALAQPTYDVGHLGGSLLARRIAGSSSTPKTYSLQAELKVRESSVRRVGQRGDPSAHGGP
jgi:LacI family transcriptional regulator